MKKKVRTALIGCGLMAKLHLKNMLQQLDTTHIAALCDPSPAAVETTSEKFREAGLEPPPAWSSLAAMLADCGDELDAVLIITPHAFHHDQTFWMSMACAGPMDGLGATGASCNADTV